MSPIPETIKGDMLPGLEGAQLRDAVNACYKLIQSRTTIVYPPKRLLYAEYLSTGHPPEAVQVGFDRAFLIKRDTKKDPLLAFMQAATLENGAIVPINPEQIGKIHYNLLNGFGVYLHFDQDRQILWVRSLKTNAEIPLSHEGLGRDFTRETRITVAALAILPESLWPAASQKGIVTGKLINEQYDDWKLSTWSLLINNQEGVITHKTNHAALVPVSPDYIGQRLSDEKNPAALVRMKHVVKNLGLVGVFSC